MQNHLAVTNAIDVERDPDIICLLLDSAIGAASKREFTNESAELDRQHAIDDLVKAFAKYELAVTAEERAFVGAPDEMDLARDERLREEERRAA